MHMVAVDTIERVLTWRCHREGTRGWWLDKSCGGRETFHFFVIFLGGSDLMMGCVWLASTYTETGPNPTYYTSSKAESSGLKDVSNLNNLG